MRLRYKTPLKLVASYGLAENRADGISTYVTEHEDPQFAVLQSDGQKPIGLKPGLYKFEFRGIATRGKLSNPCLYVDRGQGFTESGNDKFFFSYSRENRCWRVMIMTNEQIDALRLDPSIEPFVGRDIKLTIEKFSSARMTVFRTARWAFRSVIPNGIRMRLSKSGVSLRVMHWIFGDEAGEIVPPPTRGWSKVPAASGGAPTAALLEDYRDRTFVAQGGNIADFAIISSLPATANKTAFKPIAYYLPQMHPIPENDEWWGRGFSEWTNLSKAVPQFRGHYQPKLPGELGFYDLRIPDVMMRQIELARLHGIHGFCFYYYWFAGKRLLEKPVNMFLSQKGEAFNFPFCLCWANENWTRRWDGAEHEVLIAQDHSTEDNTNVFDDLLTYFRDDRYIKIDGKPVILVYRPTIIPNVDAMIVDWQKLAEKAGLPGLYIVTTNSFGYDHPDEHGFDGLCEFPPHGVVVANITESLDKMNADYDGNVYDYGDVVEFEAKKLSAVRKKGRGTKAAYFPGVMTAWDNEARKPTKGNVFNNSTPALYREWLTQAAETTIQINEPDQRFVFINAWNEWAEGAYLEPDRKFGYAYLAATADVVRELSADKAALAILAKTHNKKRRAADTVICLHIFYPSMIEEFAELLANARKHLDFDVIATVPDIWSLDDAKKVIKSLKPIRFLPMPNRGRDVAPFLAALKQGSKLGYKTGCKIHSKKSPQHLTGDAWRHRLTNGLLSSNALKAIKNSFLDAPEIALAAPVTEFMAADEHSMHNNLEQSKEILKNVNAGDALIEEFVAGTMFWFRFRALEPFNQAGFDSEDFGPELGQIDGTLAHAFERVFVSVVTAHGHSILKYKASVHEARDCDSLDEKLKMLEGEKT